MKKIIHPDKTWSLFLDRDGVINKRPINDYVKKWDDFEFLPGVLEAINNLSLIFGSIVVVSNQQGVGKGLMTSNDVNHIHQKMSDEIQQNSGRIDKVYYCPFKVEENSFLRKPAIGMALKAKKDFPEINFKKSFMVGDTINDMIFGKRLDMINVLISDNLSLTKKYYKIIDYNFNNLLNFSEFINNFS